MTEDQFILGMGLRDQRFLLEKELRLWGEIITHPGKLCYVENQTDSLPHKINSNMEKDLFEAFRRSVMDNLKLKIVDIKKQFEEIGG